MRGTVEDLVSMAPSKYPKIGAGVSRAGVSYIGNMKASKTLEEGSSPSTLANLVCKQWGCQDSTGLSEGENAHAKAHLRLAGATVSDAGSIPAISTNPLHCKGERVMMDAKTRHRIANAIKDRVVERARSGYPRILAGDELPSVYITPLGNPSAYAIWRGAPTTLLKVAESPDELRVAIATLLKKRNR